MQEGFIDTYLKDGHMYLAIEPGMIDKEFLMKYEIAEGIGSSGIYGRLMLGFFESDLETPKNHRAAAENL